MLRSFFQVSCRDVVRSCCYLLRACPDQPSRLEFNKNVEDADSYLPCVYLAGNVVLAYLAIQMAGGTLGNLPQSIGGLAAARTAAVVVHETIQRVSPIDPFKNEGATPLSVDGAITLNQTSMCAMAFAFKFCLIKSWLFVAPLGLVNPPSYR